MYKLTQTDSILSTVMVMVSNAIFNNISVISWRSVLLVQEIGVVPTCRKSLTISHNGVSSTPRMQTLWNARDAFHVYIRFITVSRPKRNTAKAPIVEEGERNL